jgi:hypothetical protein
MTFMFPQKISGLAAAAALGAVLVTAPALANDMPGKGVAVT